MNTFSLLLPRKVAGPDGYAQLVEEGGVIAHVGDHIIRDGMEWSQTSDGSKVVVPFQLIHLYDVSQNF